MAIVNNAALNMGVQYLLGGSHLWCPAFLLHADPAFLLSIRPLLSAAH